MASGMKTALPGANSERMFRVQRLRGTVGPGFNSMSPDRKKLYCQEMEWLMSTKETVVGQEVKDRK